MISRTKLIGIFASLPLLTACADHAAGQVATARAAGEITGSLHMAGGPAPGTDWTVPGTIYAFTTADQSGSPIASGRADERGRFQLRLPAGTYYLAGSSPRFKIYPAPAQPPCFAGGPVTVASAHVATASVVCAMK